MEDHYGNVWVGSQASAELRILFDPQISPPLRWLAGSDELQEAHLDERMLAARVSRKPLSTKRRAILAIARQPFFGPWVVPCV